MNFTKLDLLKIAIGLKVLSIKDSDFPVLQKENITRNTEIAVIDNSENKRITVDDIINYIAENINIDDIIKDFDIDDLSANGIKYTEEETIAQALERITGEINGIDVSGRIKSILINGLEVSINEDGSVNLGTVITEHQSLKSINNIQLVGNGNISIIDCMFGQYNNSTNEFEVSGEEITPSDEKVYIDTVNKKIYIYDSSNKNYVCIAKDNPEIPELNSSNIAYNGNINIGNQNPTINDVLAYVANALNGKQNTLTEGTGISINGDTISVETGAVADDVDLPVSGNDVREAIDDAIQTVEAQIESEQITAIFGNEGALIMWLDDDGESINIMAADTAPQRAAAPTLVVTYNGSTASIAVTNNETGATIYYTTDGSDPTSLSTELVGNSITVSEPCTVKAIAIIADKVQSVTAECTVVGCSTPTISVDNSTNGRTAFISVSADAGDTLSVTIGGTPVSEFPYSVQKGATEQTIPVVATVTNANKLSITSTQNATIGARSYDANVLAGTCKTNNPISFYNYSTLKATVTPTPIDGSQLYEFEINVGADDLNQNSYQDMNIFGLTSSDTNIVSIDHIPGSWTNLQKNAFRRLTALERVTIPTNIIKLGSRSFQYCTSLQRLVIPSSVQVISSPAARESFISGCTSLKRIDIESSVIQIQTYQFYAGDTNGTFVAVTFSSLTPMAITSSSPWNYPGSYYYYVYVPDNSFDAYNSATGWPPIKDNADGGGTRLKKMSELPSNLINL